MYGNDATRYNKIKRMVGIKQGKMQIINELVGGNISLVEDSNYFWREKNQDVIMEVQHFQKNYFFTQ